MSGLRIGSQALCDVLEMELYLTLQKESMSGPGRFVLAALRSPATEGVPRLERTTAGHWIAPSLSIAELCASSRNCGFMPVQSRLAFGQQRGHRFFRHEPCFTSRYLTEYTGQRNFRKTRKMSSLGVDCGL